MPEKNAVENLHSMRGKKRYLFKNFCKNRNVLNGVMSERHEKRNLLNNLLKTLLAILVKGLGKRYTPFFLVKTFYVLTKRLQKCHTQTIDPRPMGKGLVK